LCLLQNSDVFILAIESSCDDTAAAVFTQRVLSNVVANQLIHTIWIVPELASRSSTKYSSYWCGISKAGLKEQLSAIAFTQGPGLMGSLLVGSSFAKSMAIALNIPLIAVNHARAHFSSFIDEEGLTNQISF
jgi:N6-L-threonylcarbamoyladenine synthase